MTLNKKLSNSVLGIPLIGSRPDPGNTSEQLPNKNRRTFLGGALAAVLASRMAWADDDSEARPGDPFILLLHGLYEPVPAGHGPDLGLTSVNLSDGTYARTKIYPVFRAPGGNGENSDDHVIGTFYVSLATFLCAYDLPGGAIAMQFLPTSAGFTLLVPDGTGGQFDEGTFELTILEATGAYKAFNGGHNHMVDRLHQLKAGIPFAGFPSGYNEFCFCIISQYQFP